MLWRVSQSIRHFQYAAIRHASCSVPCCTLPSPSWPLVPLSLVRCMSAATMLQPRVEGGIRATKRDPDRWENPRRNWPQPEPDLADAVDELHDLRRLGDLSAAQLKSAATPALLFHLEDPERVRKLATLMVNTSLPQRAYRVLVLAHSLGYRTLFNALDSVAHQLAQTEQWKLLPYVVVLAKRIHGRTTARLLNWRARALLECSQFGQLDQVLSQFEDEKVKPTRRTYHLVLSGYLRNRDLARAKACLDQMEEAGFPMEAATHAIITKAYRSLGADAAVMTGALNALPDLAGDAATHLLNSLLQLALDGEDLLSALRYLKYFEEQYLGDTYDVVGAAITHAGGEVGFLLPRASLVAPDTATFAILIDYFNRKRQFPFSLQVVQNALSSGLRPDDILAASIIRAYCTAQDLGSALSVAAAICEDSPEALRVLVSLGLKQAQVSPHPLFRGLPLSINVVNALLGGVLDRQRIAGMRPIYRLMRIAGLRPNDETVGLFLSHLYRVERAGPEELLMVLKTLSAVVPPTLDHLHIVLRAIQRRGVDSIQPRGWWSLWMKLRGRKNRRDGTTWSSSEPDPVDPAPLDPAKSKSPYAPMLNPILSSLAERQIRADRESIRLRMRRHIAVDYGVDQARNDLQIMLDRGMHPTAEHLATIMRGYTLRGDMPQAKRVFKSLTETYAPTVDMYTILIAGYARQGRPARALQMFQRMITAGIQPDVGAVDALVSAWFTVGVFSQARQALIQMWTHVAPFPEELRNANTHILAKRFRSLKNNAEGATDGHSPVKGWNQWRRKSRQQRRMLLWKVNRLMIQWRRWLNLHKHKHPVQRPRSPRDGPDFDDEFSDDI